ncbi:hypothetical protein [Aliarcobacter butzleri]|uniref:hypothetical protein n=1 Tax=Aliarcobacter butzleri TaxID=28197 RepID=UPI0021B5112A|nr:hypothetical protein [Aliarcobacter butzleri]MCT7637059.1 hypothetical protein [Aliarcobacter butzleri]
MAYSQEQWNEAKFLWELDKPLSYIVEKTGISKAQISKKSNKEQWKKETEGNSLKTEIKAFEKEKETIKEKETELIKRVSNLEEYQITMLDDLIQEELGNKSLLFSTANLSLIRKNQLLTKNTKTVIEFETTYSDEGKPLLKRPIEIQIELSPNDLKTIDEGIDKNALSLELAPRHSNSQVNIQNTNAQQTNIELSKDIILETLSEFESDY